MYDGIEVKPILDIKEKNIIQKYNNESNIIQKNNKDREIYENKIKELIEISDVIKDMAKEYKVMVQYHEEKEKELIVPNIMEIKQKLFKVDIKILERWEKFVKKHKEYKVQALISLALDEFLKKYDKD